MTASTTPMTYSVHASVQAGGEAVVHTRETTIPFDGSAIAGEALPGPADLLCAALSACILKNVERFSHILPFHYESARVVVTAERQEPPPRIFRLTYQLEVVTAEPESRVLLLHKNIQRYGTITNTLAAACELSGTIEATRPVSSV
jgi:uncharacterized OsmC-like protein